MAFATQKKSCPRCQNGPATCSGCNKRFCLPHFTEHRQELDKRMDEVVQEHNQLRAAMSPQGTVHNLLARIDTWEKISIKHVKDTAQQARTDLQACLDRTKNQLINSLGNMAEELKSGQELATEKELDGWMRQLAELRKTLENPPNINIIEDDSTSSPIRMIKVIEKPSNNTTTG